MVVTHKVVDINFPKKHKQKRPSQTNQTNQTNKTNQTNQTPKLLLFSPGFCCFVVGIVCAFMHAYGSVCVCVNYFQM